MPVHLRPGPAQGLHPAQQVLDRQARDLMDRLLTDGHGEGFGTQARALARLAGAFAHILFVLPPHIFGGRLAVAAGRVGQHTFEGHVKREVAAVGAGVLDAHFFIRTVEQQLLVLRLEFAPGFIDLDAKRAADRMQRRARPTVVTAGRPGSQCALFHAESGVRHNQVGVKLALDAESLAFRAGPVRAVK